MNVKIRKAVRDDTPIILELIKGIAEYEKLSDQVTANIEVLEKELFDEKNANVILAYINDIPIGFALYFFNFSTFKGKKGLYLEDLFIKPEYRKQGYGNQMFDYLIQEAKRLNCGRMEWVCLDWNEPALEFYKKKKAVVLDDWKILRLDESKF